MHLAVDPFDDFRDAAVLRPIPILTLIEPTARMEANFITVRRVLM
jgi:hypothetical protein